MVTSMAMVGVDVAVGSARVVGAAELADVTPRQIRHLLLTFDHSIQGQIPRILGEDEQERVDTLVQLLRGTSQDDIGVLMNAFQLALGRLEQEQREQ